MTLKFGRFQVLPHRREFFAEGVQVPLGSRAFDVLMVLIEAGGELVTKDEILSRVWPGMVVEEHSLQFHISALRKVLGEDRGFIKTISGRGYRFVADITAGPGEQEALANQGAAVVAAAPPRCGRSLTNLPAPTSELIGREVVLSEASALLTAHRLVTLIGAGGIGKTRLGLAVARQLLPQFADGVWLAELAPLSDPGLVPVTVAAALGLELAGGAVSARTCRAGARREAAAAGAGQLRACDRRRGGAWPRRCCAPARRCTSVATSREPLRAEGEWVYPVPPLAVPAEDAEDADDLLRYGAVRLFVERARAAEPHFAPDRRTAAMIAAICRRLDGIPLAIELAAARAAALGVEEARRPPRRSFPICSPAAGGRRLPRHQTLRATLDWSYELLAEPERVILRRLAIFAGAFSLEAAGAVAASAEIAAVGRRRRRRQPGREVARRDGGRRHHRALSAARHDARLRAREARRKRRARTARATPRRILPGSVRAG